MENNKRLCEVDGVIGYFHCWETYYELLQDETVGCYLHCGVRAIVEFHDGVKQIAPDQIRFLDEDSIFLLNKNIEMLENKLADMEDKLVEDLTDFVTLLFLA